MTKTIQVHLGETLESAANRFLDGWKRGERGELTPATAELHIGFASWEEMVRVLSPKRLELLRHLHRFPAKSIRALSKDLGRDYRRVHEDVEALELAGLLNRDSEGVSAPYEAFDVNLRVAL